MVNGIGGVLCEGVALVVTLPLAVDEKAVLEVLCAELDPLFESLEGVLVERPGGVFLEWTEVRGVVTIVVLGDSSMIKSMLGLRR